MSAAQLRTLAGDTPLADSFMCFAIFHLMFHRGMTFVGSSSDEPRHGGNKSGHAAREERGDPRPISSLSSSSRRTRWQKREWELSLCSVPSLSLTSQLRLKCQRHGTCILYLAIPCMLFTAVQVKRSRLWYGIIKR